MRDITVFFDDKARLLITSFSYCFKVNINIFDLNLKKILPNDVFPETCPYCALLRSELGYEETCLALDRAMCRRAEGSAAPLVYPCHGGMMDSCLAITLRGSVVGYAMLGQFRTRREAPPGVREAWERAGRDPAALTAAFQATAYFEPEAVDRMINLFAAFCDHIVSRDYIRLRSVDVARLAAHWIDDHIAEPVCLGALAAYLGYSESAIYKTVKRQLGVGFKELCILKKIERFERLVTDHPALTIEEAAARVGYDDPFYFSRIYKKNRGAAPSAFAREARRTGTARTR